MLFKEANLEDFHRIKQFYWDLIDEMSDQNDKIGWKKGIYPTDSFLQESLDRGELFVLEEGGGLCASVILNSACNEGYAGVTWSIECGENEILVPHALAVSPSRQGKGIGRYFELPHEETYAEPFAIPNPDEVVFMGWYEGGELFRSGCTFHRENGRIFYFQPGHESFPTFYDKNVRTIIRNAVYWAAPVIRSEALLCPHIKKIGEE